MSDANSIKYRELSFMGFPGYRVGSDGSVSYCWKNGWQHKRYLSDTWRPMKLAINGKGYWTVNLVPPEGGSYKTFRVHRLVLLAFVGPCPEGMECRHLDGVRTNSILGNLAWGTKQENVGDRIKHRNHSPHVRFITHDGETWTLSEWARKLGLPYQCLWSRLNMLGMDFAEAISRPFLGTASNGPKWTKLKRLKSKTP